jgi:hypothetical protein
MTGCLVWGLTSAEPSPVQALRTACGEDLQAFCSTVRPGQGRVLACLSAHDEQLSSDCRAALQNVTGDLEATYAAVRFVAEECRGDIEDHCATVERGEGRVLACLERNETQVSERCIDALQEVGLR